MTPHPRPDDAARAAVALNEALQRVVTTDVPMRKALLDALLTFAAQAAQRENEACAVIADDHQAQWAVDYTKDAFASVLKGVIFQAMLSPYERADDDEPESTITLAVMRLLRKRRIGDER